MEERTLLVIGVLRAAATYRDMKVRLLLLMLISFSLPGRSSQNSHVKDAVSSMFLLAHRLVCHLVIESSSVGFGEDSSDSQFLRVSASEVDFHEVVSFDHWLNQTLSSSSLSSS